MKKEDARRHFIIDPSLDHRVEGAALDAFRALWDRVVDNATADPRSRLVTPTMVKAALDLRIRDLLGPGVLPPEISVRVNAERTGFTVEIRPAVVPYVMRQVR